MRSSKKRQIEIKRKAPGAARPNQPLTPGGGRSKVVRLVGNICIGDGNCLHCTPSRREFCRRRRHEEMLARASGSGHGRKPPT